MSNDIQTMNTVLMRAVDVNDYGAVKAALDSGVNIDARDDNGDTPLLWAVAQGKFEIVKGWAHTKDGRKSVKARGFVIIREVAQENK